jgi:hypothetical protein
MEKIIPFLTAKASTLFPGDMVVYLGHQNLYIVGIEIIVSILKDRSNVTITTLTEEGRTEMLLVSHNSLFDIVMADTYCREDNARQPEEDHPRGA